MQRKDLEHIIRAAASITNEYEIVVAGSQSILGTFSSPPDFLCMSYEADVYPLNNPELADLIDGSIGEGSMFHRHYGYYAQGIGPETCVLARNWKHRLVVVQNQNTDMKAGLCLSPEDLFIAKLAAYREKDIGFLTCMAANHLVSKDKVLLYINELDQSTLYRMTMVTRCNQVFMKSQEADLNGELENDSGDKIQF